jgi:proteasome beta subunit
LSEQEALNFALRALYTAADEDVGTGGPDFVRGIYPTAKLVAAGGIADVDESRVQSVYAALRDVRTKER